MPIIRSLVSLVVLMGMSTGCGGDDTGQPVPASLPTRGDLVIGIDESLKPFADAEIAMFSADYPDARIIPLYLPEKQVVEKLLTNELQTGIICRDLFPEETALLAGNYAHSARSFKLADDEIVAVVNEDNPVGTLSLGQLKEILAGKISDWDALQDEAGARLPASRQGSPTASPITVVITDASSINRFFTSGDPPSPVAAYALETTPEVVDYVRNNAAAVGIVGGSWFFQKESGYSDIKVLSSSEENPAPQQREPRFKREVYAVTHEPVTGLGSGFISFMASRKGQLILSKAGMTPFKPIEREIRLLGSFPE